MNGKEQEFRLASGINIRSALLQASAFLELRHLPQARRDAELLLCHSLGKDRSFILAHPEIQLEARHVEILEVLVAQRSRHYPIQYMAGSQEFYGRDFLVTGHTLIPRPETELLIEVALPLLDSLAAGIEIMDVGTGTGCVALTLLLELPGGHAVATDISEKALQTARMNSLRLECENHVSFVCCDLFSPFPPLERFHLIVSNPPYVSILAQDIDRSVRDYEPRQAVFAGPTGLEVYRRLFTEGMGLLAPDGFLLLELGADQYPDVAALAAANGWVTVSVHQDLAGVNRCAAFRPAPLSRKGRRQSSSGSGRRS